MKREPRETIAESLMGQYNYFGRWFAMADIVLQGLAGEGLVVVSAEDLRAALGHWRRPVTNELGGQGSYDRLRAALNTQQEATP